MNCVCVCVCVCTGEAFDLVFVDANKKQYSNYYNLIFDAGLLRVGGVCVCVSVAAISLPFEYLIYYTHTHTGILLVDNVLWKGKVPQLYGDSIYYVYVVYI